MLQFWVVPPLCARATLMSLAVWKLRRQTHHQLTRCECSVACKRGDQFLSIHINQPR